MIAVFGGTPLNVAPQAHASLTSPSTRPWEVHDELSAHSSVSPSLSPACCLLYGWNFMNHTKNRIDSGMKIESIVKLERAENIRPWGPAPNLLLEASRKGGFEERAPVCPLAVFCTERCARGWDRAGTQPSPRPGACAGDSHVSFLLSGLDSVGPMVVAVGVKDFSGQKATVEANSVAHSFLGSSSARP